MKVLQAGAKILAVVIFAYSINVFGQSPRAGSTPLPKLIYSREKTSFPVASGNNLYCAGYIQQSPVNTSYEIVGADNEREQNVFSQGNYVYISRGASAGVKVGDTFSVIRPRGKFDTRYSPKRNLGIYVQEVGMVEVVNVKQEVSVAVVKNSCDNFLLGDLLQPVPARTSPIFQQRPSLDLFAAPTGKTMGRIVLARDGREALSAEEIVYIDLGAEDNVQIGDYYTIYRPLGKGGVLNSNQPETLSARDEGYQSKAYRGGKFSIMAPRKSGENADGRIVTTRNAKSRRPAGLRKVVGELVILNVKERTATAIITRNAQEIHTGDRVELQ